MTKDQKQRSADRGPRTKDQRRGAEGPRPKTQEEPAEPGNAEQVSLDCICGRTVELNALEEYELPTFAGACPCGRVWSLTELSAQVPDQGED